MEIVIHFKRIKIMAKSRDEIFKSVQNVLVDALGIDEDEVKPQSTLIGDLGAESIDFLDIVFRLEKAFGIKIPREELFPIENMMNNPEYIKDGKLTPKGISEIKSKMPHIDLSGFETNPDVNKLGDLFTVESIVKYIEGKLN